MSDKKDYLSPTQQRALGELKQRLNSQFDYIERLILYGSTARGNSDD
jgi:hypothetical protein